MSNSISLLLIMLLNSYVILLMAMLMSMIRDIVVVDNGNQGASVPLLNFRVTKY